jgi:hypothetical protein
MVPPLWVTVRMVPPERGFDNDYRSGGAVVGVAATDCQQR